MLYSIFKGIKHNKYKIIFLFFLMYVKRNFYSILPILIQVSQSGRKLLEKEKSHAIKLIQKSVFKKYFRSSFDCLPTKGKEREELFKIVSNRYSEQNHKISGTIYNNKVNLSTICNYMFNLYQYSNPLHADLYPELIKMESEIISMIGKLFDMPNSGGGNLTTGGTESTILAIKAYKKYKLSQSTFNFRKLEVITTKTGHAAINKACELLDLNLVYVKLNEKYQMDVEDLKKKINNRTCCVVASYPCYAYGILDPIKEVADICKIYNTKLHVDACLGGFITQFNKELKISFDIGFDSISIDPHKFGYAPKGSSVLLWRENEMRHFQYFIVSDWTGGIYASPSLPGSRCGSQIATTWAVLISNGYDYYKMCSGQIIEMTLYLKKEINKIDTFYVLGDPNVNVVAFNSTKYPTGQIIDNLSKEGWNINILQNPQCLHLCITPYNIPKIYEFIDILKKTSKQDIKCVKNSMVSIYGMASKINNTKIINDVIAGYLDLTTKN